MMIYNFMNEAKKTVDQINNNYNCVHIMCYIKLCFIYAFL